MLSKSYFTGKQLSTYLLAVSSSKVLRGDDNDDDCNKLFVTTKSITNDLLNQCITFLISINAPNKMKSLLKERLDGAIGMGSLVVCNNCQNGALFLIIVNVLHSGYRKI